VRTRARADPAANAPNFCELNIISVIFLLVVGGCEDHTGQMVRIQSYEMGSHSLTAEEGFFPQVYEKVKIQAAPKWSVEG
jgi:hypothetical protein